MSVQFLPSVDKADVFGSLGGFSDCQKLQQKDKNQQCSSLGSDYTIRARPDRRQI